MGALLNLLFWVAMVPGYWLPAIVGKFKQFGDGTGNESCYIEGYMWLFIGAFISWAIIIFGFFCFISHLHWI